MRCDACCAVCALADADAYNDTHKPRTRRVFGAEHGHELELGILPERDLGPEPDARYGRHDRAALGPVRHVDERGAGEVVEFEVGRVFHLQHVLHLVEVLEVAPVDPTPALDAEARD